MCSRYENVAMQEQYVSEAKRTIETLQYRNERAMTFEKFVSKLVQAADELEKRGKGMHNADVVEIIWQRVATPGKKMQCWQFPLPGDCTSKVTSWCTTSSSATSMMHQVYSPM